MCRVQISSSHFTFLKVSLCLHKAKYLRNEKNEPKYLHLPIFLLALIFYNINVKTYI